MRSGKIFFAFLVSVVGCDRPSPRQPLAAARLTPTLPFRGIVPCAHPMPKSVAFDEPTAVRVTAQDAFADIEGQCTAPVVWATSGSSAAEEKEISVEVELP
jgi:hypothetical protein